MTFWYRMSEPLSRNSYQSVPPTWLKANRQGVPPGRASQLGRHAARSDAHRPLLVTPGITSEIT